MKKHTKPNPFPIKTDCLLCAMLAVVKDDKNASIAVREAVYYVECLGGCHKLYSIGFACGSCKDNVHRHVSGLAQSDLDKRIVKP